ncbi:MAG: cadherin-like beta sandwich domain-containing protein [Fibrobacteres bacterium]|nr:cadherin-like beta sandwich domain-containing protein [Fibrobacterota bacterium]
MTGEEQAFLDVRADSTWTAFDQVAVVLTEKNGTPIDTLFKGKLTSPSQLRKLPAPGYDGRQVQIVLIGFKDGKPAKTETRNYDGRSQSETGPNLVVVIPVDTGSGGDSSLDLKPDTLRIYLGGPAVPLAPSGSFWTGKTITWSSANEKIATVNGGFVTAIGPGSCFIRAGSGNSKDSSRVTVVRDSPILDPGGDTAVSIGAIVSFAVKVRQEFGGISAFKWSLDGDSAWDDSASGMPSQASVLITPPRTFGQAGTLSLRFLVRDGEGNETIATRALSISSQIPKITAFPGDSSITVGDSLSFAAKAEVNAGSLKQYAWDFGDASPASAGTLSGIAATIAGGHRFGKEGAFKVVLTVENDAGVRISASLMISVAPTVTQSSPPVILAFTPSDTDISINDSVSFAATVTGSAPLDSYSWDFDGDGSPDLVGTLSGTNAALKAGKRFLPAASNTVTLKVTDKAGKVQTKQVTVLVEADPPKADAGKDTAVDAGALVYLHGKASDRLGKVVKTEWKIGSGNYSVAPPETSLVASLAGQVEVPCSFRVTDDDGQKDSDVVIVSVRASTDATLKGLTLSTGTLAPEFSPTVTAYTASVPENLSMITVNAVPNSPGTSYTVNGVPAGSSPGIPLHLGQNIVTILVTGQDNSRKSYRVTVTRLDQTPPGIPVMSNPTIFKSPTPTWVWTSGGDGSGTFRYKLDDSILTSGAVTAKVLSFTSPALADGYHTLYVQEEDSVGNWSETAYFKIAVTVGPISWYKFDGNFKDSGPNANDGTGSGTLTFVADHTGAASKAVSFASGNGQITMGDASILTGNSVTVSAWIYLASSASTDTRYFVYSGGVNFASEGSAIYFAVSTTNTNSAWCTVNVGEWTQITGTYDGSDIKIYKNGVLQSTTPQPGTVTGNLSQMYLGYFNSVFWDGRLDDLRYYNRVLSQTEITAVANGSM